MTFKESENDTGKPLDRPKYVTGTVSVFDETIVAAPSTAAVGERKGRRLRIAEKSDAGVLANAGRVAMLRHGFQEAFITSDGMTFRSRVDAKGHVLCLANKNIIKVTRK